MKKRHILIAALSTLVVGVVLWAGYRHYLSPTRIALVNFPPYHVANFLLSNDDPKIVVEEVSDEHSLTLKGYDGVLVFGAGFRPTDLQKEGLERAEAAGVAVHTFVFDSHAVEGSNVSPEQQEQLSLYYKNSNRPNFRNLLAYMRQEFDSHKWGVRPADPPVIIPEDVYYYTEEGRYFESADALTEYLKSQGVYHEGAPRIALLGGVNFPVEGNRSHIDSLIAQLTRRGYNVYPFASGERRSEMLREIAPVALINMPMGRVDGERAVGQFVDGDILYFAPLPISQSHEEWLASPQGASGGYLTARVVLPEIDGGLLPLVISTQQEEPAHGLMINQPELERLANFVDNVDRYIRLRTTPNKEKRVGVVYFRGAGQSSLVATGLEVAPSLYRFLTHLRAEGYDLSGLPDTFEAFNRQLQRQGTVWGSFATGAVQEFISKGNPLLIPTERYRTWCQEEIAPAQWQAVLSAHGEPENDYMATIVKGESHIAVAALRYGNVTVMPQQRAGLGGDDFKMVHGTGAPPPHAYIAPYLWLRKEHKADVLVHFGTHGSLEFTQGKQAALSYDDWADRLVGSTPHVYYYTISNVGEGIIAKRRLHATLVSYLTPPFMESRTRDQYRALFDKLEAWRATPSDAHALALKQLAVKLGMHRDLQLDGDTSRPYSEEEVAMLEQYAEEIANEKMTGRLYTLGTPYAPRDIEETVTAISADPIAHQMAHIHYLKGALLQEQYESTSYVNQRYLPVAKRYVRQVLSGSLATDRWLELVDLTADEVAEAQRTVRNKALRDSLPPAAWEWAQAVVDLQESCLEVPQLKEHLVASPTAELQALTAAMSGHYIAPSPGGDVVRSPNTLPTGRNLYSINAENTPTLTAWNTGVSLANATLERYRSKHGQYPHKVSYTYWAGEFIESEGATVAQTLYMLGVEPTRDRMGRVQDLRLIPSAELGRPRIDVVVQTSGQLRDLAASRLALITQAVRLAMAATDDIYPNYVREGAVRQEQRLVEKGVAPAQARHLSAMRVFGGLNGTYGTGIKEFVEKGDAWESSQEIASVYLNNMSAIYGSDEEWGMHVPDFYAIALEATDVVVQPRQNNTWGALSLDHMYEFMGGVNTAIESVTGKSPDTYLADYRNRNRRKLQELKEAIGVESRTTLLNPEYIREKMKGGASSAGTFAKTFRNTYGWSATKRDAIDNELWDELYAVYVDDRHALGVREFFGRENPFALQEMAAVMLESARKGLWAADEAKVTQLAQLYYELVAEHGLSGSDFTADNTKLSAYVGEKLPSQSDARQLAQLERQAREVSAEQAQAMRLQQERLSPEAEETSSDAVHGLIRFLPLLSVPLLALLFYFLRRRKVDDEEE